MVLNLTTLDDLHAMKRELVEEIRVLLHQDGTRAHKRWLKTEEVIDLLQLSASTLQTLRRNGTLPFSRIGAIIYYDLEDIDRILEDRKQRQLELTSRRKELKEHRPDKGRDSHHQSQVDFPLAA